ncbi:MAG: hypothetical protein SVZ03_09085 [Spirochaetota bacterium]|nr:hypothetical protein [Spirochaetota bacterium]
MKSIKDRIRQLIIQERIIPKIICFVLAVILWAYIASTKIGEVKFRIPIKVMNLSESFTVSNNNNSYVTLFLKGRKDELKSINIKDIKAFVNLRNPVIGRGKKYPIEIVTAGIPEEVDIDLSRKDVYLKVEKMITKRVKVIPRISGHINDGYVLGDIKVIPEYVSLSGPESFIQNVDFIETNKLHIENERGLIVKEIAINKKNLKKVRFDVTNVRLTIPIVEAGNLLKIKKRIELRNKKMKYQYQLSDEYVTVNYKLEKEDAKISEQDIETYIDISSVDIDILFENDTRDVDSIERAFSIKFKVKADGVNIYSLVPDSVLVKIIKE